MFVAVRDLRFAKFRFGLMIAVIGLLSALVGVLSGLTAGLARDNTSAIAELPADHLAFSAPSGGGSVSFADSGVGPDAWARWAQGPGVINAEPLGIATIKAIINERSAFISAFGVQPASVLAPAGDLLRSGATVLSEGAAAALTAAVGDTVTVGGLALTVVAVAGDARYSHTAVIWTSLDDWSQLSGGSSSTPARATIIALRTEPGADLSSIDERLGMRTVALDDSLTAIGSFEAENSSLVLIRGFLYVISGLIVGAFFAVWTMQRTNDVAVLKALGASTGYLLRDAIGQAAVVLAFGALAGGVTALATGLAVGGQAPFSTALDTLLLPILLLIILGGVGAGLSILRIVSVDPLTALSNVK